MSIEQIGLFVTGTQPISHRVGWLVGRSVFRSVGPSHFAFFAFLGILRVEKFVFEHAPAQIITAPAQPSATGSVVYTALLYTRSLLSRFTSFNSRYSNVTESFLIFT